MGDLLFDDGRFGDCITPYARATEGGDPSIAAVALYKTGWAQFNRERFAEAADAFRAVIDLHRARGGALRVDLDQEAEAYLVHSLARAGGAEAFAAYFDRIGPRPYEQALLRSLGQHLRRFSLYDGAAGADELALARFPLEADALLSAQRLVETRDRAGDPARADASRLEVAPRFAPGSAWAAAQGSDSVRSAGADFARSAWRTVAERHHALGRERGSAADWREALRLHDTLRVRFPADPDRAGWQLLAGEAAFRLDDPAQALARYAAAAEEGRDSIPAIARWQRVAVTDAWYESTRTAGRTGRTGIGRDSLALAVIARADEFLERHPDDPRGADLLWRQGQLALAHGWHEQALGPLEGLADRHPRDPRAPLARTLEAEALFKLGRFAEAGRAFEGALTAAREVGLDSLAARAREALPVCAYRRAEAAVAADSTAHERHARLYEEVATRWPDYVHAPDAQYRAGLAWMRAGRPREAIRVMQALALDHPKSSYLLDAQLTVARAWEQEGERERAADAYAQFAARHPADASAGDAMLHAADLYAAAGATERAEALRMDYVRQHPEDVATAMELYETLAQRELRAVGPGRPLAALLPRAVPRTRKGSGAAAAAAKPTALATYLRMAADHPELASRELIGQVRFLEAEEAFEACSTIVLRQPLEKSIAARQKALDRTVAAYRRTAEAGAPGWANASAYRLGRSLVAFGEALEKSERPADLKGNDLEAYEDVLWEQAQAFFRRGEGVWDDLLRRKGREGADDPWIARARGAYQDRLAERLLYRPEVEYPLVEAERPAKIKREETSGEPLSLAGGSRDNATVSDRGSRRP
jgi:outer membrane protein assembly factor BamD (BamD/ComL family)